MKTLRLLCIHALIFCLHGCTTLVGATTKEPIELDPNRRSMGTMIDDSQLEIVAKVNLNKVSEDLKRAPVTVTSFNRVILLTGQVKDGESRELATKTVSKITPVRQVYNELQVQAPISFLASTNDAWLTTKVKTKMAFSKRVRAKRIKVLTENSIVYLMGMVPRYEAESAADIASSTKGVQKVVLAIEYTDRD